MLEEKNLVCAPVKYTWSVIYYYRKARPILTLQHCFEAGNEWLPRESLLLGYE